MRIFRRILGLVASFATAALLAACAGSPSSLVPGPVSTSSPAPAQKFLYAYVPAVRALFRYPLGDTAQPEPQPVLSGTRTGLTAGHGGIALGATGKIYVLDGDPIARFLVFGANATGNVRPIRSARLGNISASGLALDGNGNYWTADTIDGTLQRYSLSATGSVHPNLSITPELDTPIGMMRAYPTTVALDGSGDVYCICVVLYRGASAQGVTQYHLAGSQTKIVRSFYDFQLPELPTSMLRIGDKGEMYLASSLFRTGTFAYPPTTPSGEVHGKRRIAGPLTTIDDIASLTTDGRGRLYAATATGVAVFAEGAHGNVAPVRVLPAPNAGSWTLDDYGDFFAIH